MEKKNFKNPKLEIVEMGEDVIQTSGLEPEPEPEPP